MKTRRFLVLVAGLVLAAATSLHGQTFGQQVAKTVDAYLATVPSVQVRQERRILGSQADSIAYAESRIAYFLSIAKSYSNLNADTKRIWVQAQASAHGLMSSQHMVMYSKNGKSPVIILIPTSIVYQNRADGGIADMFYNQYDKALYLPDFDLPAVDGAAVFYHEYDHALQDKDDQVEDPVMREALAHSLSTLIIETGLPEYKRKVLEIVHRRQYVSFQDALAGITVGDLAELDRIMLGAPDHVISSSLMYQHLIAVGFEFADEHVPGKMGAKKEIYAWLVSLNGGGSRK